MLITQMYGRYQECSGQGKIGEVSNLFSGWYENNPSMFAQMTQWNPEMKITLMKFTMKII
jgi:hypothetical protein